MKVLYTPPFLRQLKKLESSLQEEVFEKIKIFESNIKNKMLKVHKLKGRLKGNYSFSINYKTRIVFEYLNQNEVVFLAIGNHSVYDI